MLPTLKTFTTITESDRFLRRVTVHSPHTTVATPVGDGVNALSSPLFLLLKSTKAITGESSVGVVGPRA